jgi:hypothetical protein
MIRSKSYALMSVFKAAGHDNALTGCADVGNFVTVTHGSVQPPLGGPCEMLVQYGNGRLI